MFFCVSIYQLYSDIRWLLPFWLSWFVSSTVNFKPVEWEDNYSIKLKRTTIQGRLASFIGRVRLLAANHATSFTHVNTNMIEGQYLDVFLLLHSVMFPIYCLAGQNLIKWFPLESLVRMRGEHSRTHIGDSNIECALSSVLDWTSLRLSIFHQDTVKSPEYCPCVLSSKHA